MAVRRHIRHEVIRENGPICPQCACTMWHRDVFGTTGPDFLMATVDHIRPKSKGGRDRKKNLRCLCRRCNQKRGNLLQGQRPIAPPKAAHGPRA